VDPPLASKDPVPNAILLPLLVKEVTE